MITFKETSPAQVELWANDHLVGRVYEYLSLTDLVATTTTCKTLLLADSEDSAWRARAFARWTLTDKSRKSLGGATLSSMRDLYKLLHHRLQIPDGKYTGKQNPVFGRACGRGVAAWLLVHHAATAMLKETRFQGELCRRVEMRLCVQNIVQHAVQVPLCAESVQIGCQESEEVKEGRLAHSDLRVLARNGSLVPPIDPATPSAERPRRVALRPLEYVVLGCSVYCPESVESEPDFLTMITALSISLDILVAHEAESIPFTLSLRRNSDEDIWSNYQTLPNGLVMVRDKQNNW